MVAKTLDSLEERPAGRRRQDRLCRDSPKWFCGDMGQLGRVTEQMKIYQNIYIYINQIYILSLKTRG